MESTHITAERILDAHAGGSPQIKRVLETLFPEVFEGNKVFCKIGTTFKMKGCFGYDFALFKIDETVRILNITDLTPWKGSLEISELKCLESLTSDEFRKLSKFTNLSIFYDFRSV